MNLVATLGRDFFNKKFAGAYILYQDRVLRIDSAGQQKVRLTTATQEEVMVDNNYFIGFKVLAYPKLGWRRFNKDVVAHLTKIQSANRGLRKESTSQMLSPATKLLKNHGVINVVVKEDVYMESVFKPKWDTKADIPKMLAGNKLNVVLNEDVMIEPSTTNEREEVWDVFVGTVVAANYKRDGRITYISQAHKPMLQRMIG